MILEHSMQGFYGSPEHGGNRGYASFKMLDIDYPHPAASKPDPNAKP